MTLNVQCTFGQEKIAYTKPASSVEIFHRMKNFTNPAEDLYDMIWTNQKINAYEYVPTNFEIDLRNFSMPTKHRKITSNYGYRKQFGRDHHGVDVKVYIGDTICSAFSGKVRICKYNAGGYGYYVVIRHNNGLETLYGHLSKILVKENQTVKSGEPIGLGGNTGKSTGSHLHFETRLCGVSIDPLKMFDFENQDMVSNKFTFKK